ncbi:MAG: dephospho-CoA kinase [Chloroflexi bacterium]|nr:dephospho-CoA kinase [Chloroflexota bacterium]
MTKKQLIGLTGNIATGKSVVRRMLEHLGAYGIDADALGHRVISMGAPGYQPVVDEFGKYILDERGEIDRTKLGNLVFSDPAALAKLEAIVHPFVRQAMDHLIKNSSQNVVVVEAIKLLESPLRERMDSIWVVTSSEEAQIGRLARKRGMSAADARQRMAHQTAQGEKAAAADVVIHNDGSVEETWQQVYAIWKGLFPDEETQPLMKAVRPVASGQTAAAAASGAAGLDLTGKQLGVMRAGPRQAEEIAAFITRLSGGKKSLSRTDVMAQFGEKAYMLLRADQQIVALVGWQVENLVTRTDDLWVEPAISMETTLEHLFGEVESASKELQAEAILVFVLDGQALEKRMWEGLGYEQRVPESLGVNAWQEAARASMPKGAVMYFKQLRIDRVLRPI